MISVEKISILTGIPVKELNRLNKALWYHGTNIESAKNIEESGVDAFYNVGNMLDFGPGFYLTDTKERAESYIKRVPIITTDGELANRDSWAVIEFQFNPYELLFGDENLVLNKYSYLNFPEHDREFAEFTFKNRIYNVNNESPHKKDIIWGVMSDSFPDQVINQYKNGDITYEEALDLLKKPNSMKQLYIGSQEICEKLEIKNIYYNGLDI